MQAANFGHTNMDVGRQFVKRRRWPMGMGQDVLDVAAGRKGCAAAGDDDAMNGWVGSQIQ